MIYFMVSIPLERTNMSLTQYAITKREQTTRGLFRFEIENTDTGEVVDSASTIEAAHEIVDELQEEERREARYDEPPYREYDR